jgi:hypothetical protein
MKTGEKLQAFLGAGVTHHEGDAAHIVAQVSGNSAPAPSIFKG